jgi:serine/threonine protein kinase/Flp pilus assembly protein TadD
MGQALGGLCPNCVAALAFGVERDSPGNVAGSVPLTEKPGDRIGHYKLLEKIGEGGCGVVYLAQQQEPVRRRVALKVIKLGMDTKSVIARFEAERQVLALMDHANIAKVLDAGATESGRPYFVMELVDGIKITDFCDRNNLSTRERLELLVQVCSAVQHAHQKGIIHRDLKPSNILVTQREGVPVPKVIDFGIAKATTGQPLTDKTLFTAFEQFIGTPAYMSPEQAELSELSVDTRSDIYSLGVLLYELLTGSTPFDTKELLQSGLDEMRKIIRERDPVRPSSRLSQTRAAHAPGSGHSAFRTLHSAIDSDLDWIVMKCLEKDRERRYETATGLASDVQRYLADEPVVARPPGKFYRFQKLVRRNKLVFGAIGAVGVALLLGLALSTWLLVKERAARRNAVAAQQKAQQVATFLKKMLQGVGPSKSLGRDSTMLGEILDQTAKSVGQDLTNQPEVAVELYLTLADTYHDLGLYKEMEAVSRESLQLARSRLGAENQGVADSLQNVGAALMHQHRNLEEAEQCSRDSLAMCQKLLGNDSARVADALAHLAIVLTVEDKLGEAEVLQRRALAMYRKLFGKDRPEAAKLLRDLAITLEAQSNRLVEAENLDREALAAQRRLLGDVHPEVAKSVNFLGEILSHQGRLLEAEAKHREALAMWRKLLAGDRFEVLRALQRLTLVLLGQNKLAEAETRMREALAMQSKVQVDEGTLVVEWLDNLAGVLFQKGKVEEAEARYGEALAIRRKLLGNEAPEVASSFEHQAALFRWQGRLEEAETNYRQALAIERREFGELDSRVAHTTFHLAIVLKKQGKPQADALFYEAAERMNVQALNEHAWQLATDPDAKFRDGAWAVALAEKAVAVTNRKDPTILDTLAAAYAEAGRFIDAARVQQEAIALAPNSEDNHAYAARLSVYASVAPYRDPGLMDELSRALLLQGKFAEAEATARECFALREKLPSDDWRIFDTRSMLGASLAGLKKFAEAESFLVAGYDGLEQQKGQLPAEAQEPLAEAARRLAEFYEVSGQAEKAAEWRKREALAQAAAQSAPEAAARRSDGAYAAQHARFKEAATDFARVIELRPDDHAVWHWQAVTLLQLGQLEAYRELRRRSLARFANTTDPNTAERIAKDFLLLPASELAIADKMAATAVSAGTNHPDISSFRFVQGLAEYRQERFANAVDWMQQVLSDAGKDFNRDAQAWLVLAMAQHELNRADEARDALTKGIDIVDTKMPKPDSGDLGPGWVDWIIAHALLDEARELIQSPRATAGK